jgi:signal transduction histidine kinase
MKGDIDSMTPQATDRLSRNQAFTHEFVNSLASVRSLAELLADYPSLDDGDRSRFIAIIREETERLARLMKSLNAESTAPAAL